MLPPPLNSVSQIAYVVTDLDQALKYWIDIMGAGPFFVFEHVAIEQQQYRGGASDVDVTLAVGNSGDVQIELIYCESDAPSVYQEFLQAGRSGVHHLGMMPEDFDAACSSFRALGCEAAFEFVLGGTEVVYFDTVALCGHFTELWEPSDSFRQFQLMVKEAAQDWDGADPIRVASL